MKYSVGASYTSVPAQKTGEAVKSNLGFGRTDEGGQSWLKKALPELRVSRSKASDTLVWHSAQAPQVHLPTELTHRGVSTGFTSRVGTCFAPLKLGNGLSKLTSIGNTSVYCRQILERVANKDRKHTAF